MRGEVQRGTERGTFDVVRAAPGGDGWLGGFALPGTTIGRYLAVDFFGGAARLGPDDPPLPLRMTMTTPTNVRFDLKTPKDGLFVFEAPVDRSGAMKGTVVHGTARAPFELTLARPYDRNAARRYEGTYVAAGHTLRVWTGGAGLGMFDTNDGSVRRLHAVGADAFVVGPSLSGTSPWTAEVTFAFDKGAKSATRVVVKGRDGRALEARRQDYRTEELRFKSGAVTLAGTLYLPPGNGPFPAMVNVHGSGRATRDDTWPQAMARVFLDEGVAVFLYDKRGVAESEGDYVPGPAAINNVSPENLERLASDARAAAATLAARKDVAKVGLYGISQAGWIMPLAAASSKDVKFMVVASGPLVPTSLEAIWSDLLGDGERAATMTLEQADAVVKKAPRVGFNSAPYAAKLDIPVLWAYGEIDTSIPVRECLRAFEEIRAGHDFEAVTFKNAGHALYEVTEDVETENAFSRGFVPGYLDKVRAWLRAHVTRAR
jgi:dienelactone hydrolase